MRRFATETITVNLWRPELEYVQSIVDVQFTYSPQAAVTLNYDSLPASHGLDGLTNWSGNPTYAADIHIVPKFTAQPYLFLHEMGHVLGLEQPPDHATPLNVTLMAWAEHVNSHYDRDEVGHITRYTPSDILDLQARYGTADGVTEVIGDWRDNVIFGGQGIVDPIDGNEVLHGGAGNDVLYGNGGNDLLCGDEADKLYGGLGADVLYIGAGDQVMDFNPVEDVMFYC